MVNIMLKETTKDEFFKQIGPLDVTLDIISDYPYTTVFKMRKTKKEMGRIVDSYSEGKKYPIVEKYFII